MPNPEPGLQGWANKSEPGWQDRVMEGVRNRKPNRYRAKHRHTLDMSYGQRDLLAQAAEQRGMVASAYVRRALAAFLAHDLDMDFADVVKEWGYPLPFGHMAGTTFVKPSSDDGTGYGKWQIEGLR